MDLNKHNSPYLITFITMGLLWVLSVDGQAQGGIDREIEVVKKKKIVLPKAVKYSQKIKLLTPIRNDTGQAYINFHDFMNPSFTGKRFLPQIQPATFPLETNNRKNFSNRKLEGYIKGGGGNFSTSYAQGAVNYRPNSSAIYGLSLKHHQSRTGAIRGALSATAENEVQARAQFYTNNFVMGIKANYELSQYHFYGYDEGQSVEKDTVGQQFQRFGLSFHQASIDTKSRFQFDWGLGVNYLRDAFSANETQGDIFGRFGYHIDGQSTIRAYTNLNFAQRTDAEQVSRFLFQFKPYYIYTQGNWNLEGGVNLVYENDTTGTGSDFHVYPLFTAEFSVLPNLLLSASLKGDIQRTSLNSFTRLNPFLQANIPLAHTNQALEALLGVQGNLKQSIFYKVQVGYEQLQNLYFFVNSASDSARFEVLYQTDPITRWKVDAQIGYEPNTYYNVYLNGTLFNYQLPSTQAEAWHRPLYRANLTARWSPTPKWRLNLNYYGMGGIKAKNFITNEVRTLDFISDLNFKVDYLFWEKGNDGAPNLSAFVTLNNIFAKNYQRYLYYPRQGFNFLIGIMYGF